MPNALPGMFNSWPTGSMWPRTARNAAQNKIINVLRTFFCSPVFISGCVSKVWPKTILPVWPRNAQRLDTPARPSILMLKNYTNECFHNFTSLFLMTPSSPKYLSLPIICSNLFVFWHINVV